MTFRRKRATIQTLPGIAAKHRESTGALLYDHMFDHNRLRRTRKQRRKERRRASFPERKGSNGFHAHVTPGSNPFGTTMPQVRILSLGPFRVFITDLGYGHSNFFFPSVYSILIYVRSGRDACSFCLCGDRASEIFHTHALPGVSFVVSREHIFREDDISHEPVMDHHTLGAVSARALRLVFPISFCTCSKDSRSMIGSCTSLKMTQFSAGFSRRALFLKDLE